MLNRQPIIIFDANEALLDLNVLHPVFDRIFGHPAVLRLWFAHLITDSEGAHAGRRVRSVHRHRRRGAAVPRMLAATRGTAELTDRFATMPPHPEVPTALRRLSDHGFRLFTLTDNALSILGRRWSMPT